MRLEEKSFKYTSILYHLGDKEYIKTVKDGSGEDMKLYIVKNYETRSVARVAREEEISEVDAIKKYYDRVHTTENAQTSIRTRVQEATGEDDNLYVLEYIPVSGRNKGRLTELLFVGPRKRLVSWFKNVTHLRNGQIFKREKLGTFWEDVNWNNVTREGGVRFPNGQKPEKLISICIELATNPGDLVLDSFAGSGTTGAVAHKMGRRWIMIELGDHCHTHIIPRLQKVIDGTDPGGITSAVNWQGGGGFRYYKLAPSLLKKDKWGNWVINPDYHAEMLTAALCKLEGFTYAPSDTLYWQQGYSTERDFIYVTTQNLSHDQLAQLSDEVGTDRSLLVLCMAFRGRPDFANLTIKKIPKHVLTRCEWDHDDYSLKVENLPKAPPKLGQIELEL
jgi:adenine-specific DNA-methyltransferase